MQRQIRELQEVYQRMTTHALDATPDTTVEVLSRDTAPVLTVDPGDTVIVESLDAAGYLQRQTWPGEPCATMFPQRRGHCLTGPIEVRGAQAADVIAVHFVSIRPATWGWTVAGGRDTPVTRWLGLVEADPSWLLWDLDADAATATADRGFVRPLAPFLGVVGTAPHEPGEHSTVPPRPGSGGNIDCRELVAGSTLYLPVAVGGALLHLGDGHAAQGDGEVGGTAIECAMTTTVTIDLVTDPAFRGVHADTPAGRITFGFDADLNVATAQALDAMITWIQTVHRLDRGTALALASVSVDLRVTQIANQTWGVHAVAPPDLVPPRS